MNTEFANQKDIFDYIKNHKLKLVVFDDKHIHWRTAFLVFEDKTYMRLLLEDCYTSKFFGCKYFNQSYIITKNNENIMNLFNPMH